MSYKQKLLCFLSVMIVMTQNYESQISHVPNAQIDLWTLHDWVGALMNVVLSGMFAWKIFLTDPKAAAQTATQSTQQ